MHVTSVPIGNPNFMITFVPRGIEKYRPPIIYILVFWIWLFNGFCSKYGWLDTFVRPTVGKIPSGFLRIVQFVLGKQDEYVSPIVRHFCPLYILLMIRYSLLLEKTNGAVCESYCLLLCTILYVVYWLINDIFHFSLLHDQIVFTINWYDLPKSKLLFYIASIFFLSECYVFNYIHLKRSDLFVEHFMLF